MGLLPETTGWNGLVGVMPDQPALILDWILGGYTRQDFGKPIDVNDAVILQQAKALRQPFLAPGNILVQRHEVVIGAKVPGYLGPSGR